MTTAPLTSAAGALAGLRVLDLSRLQPGGFTTLLLADLGAEVVRVEQPGGGDPLRVIPGENVGYNRGKRSMTLDLKHQSAPDVLRRLVAGFDVVVESSRPGSLEARGMGYPQLSEDNPGLIWCSITGFGRDSPYIDRPGHDITFLGYAGLLDLMAGETTPPTPDFVLAVPLGAMMAVVGILAALTERNRSGRGRLVDASIVDAATWILSEHVARVAEGQPAGWGQAASRRAYRCADGKLLTVAAAEPRSWAILCRQLGLGDLEDRLWAPGEEQAEIAATLQAVFLTRPAAAWVEQLAEAGVGPVLAVAELFEDRHVVARGSIVELDGARVLRSPLRLVDRDGGEDPVVLTPPATVGQHTEETLAGAGFTPDEVAALRVAGAL